MGVLGIFLHGGCGFFHLLHHNKFTLALLLIKTWKKITLMKIHNKNTYKLSTFTYMNLFLYSTFHFIYIYLGPPVRESRPFLL
jgi:hypothetical protein